MPPSAFPFPREYHFPPFFTPQPNLTTLHAQQTKWASLVLSYARHHRLFKLSLSTAPQTELFHNARINRGLSNHDVHSLMEFMHRDGLVEYITRDVVFVYWKRPEDWAALIEQYVEDTGQKGSVLTVYEISEGEGTRTTELHGLDHDLLLKALNIIVKKGKAQVFGSDDSLGVKFF
ncbi:hypothetical protein E4U55_006371 [Claviceps digitariae]|nr:hypothetical protein E4U55_006371 [Claviceps digitariae]